MDCDWVYLCMYVYVCVYVCVCVCVCVCVFVCVYALNMRILIGMHVNHEFYKLYQ